MIRADANAEIGSGHVMRCAALGMRLMARGAQVRFVCRHGLPSRLAGWLREQGFALDELGMEEGDWRHDLAATCAIARDAGPFDLMIVDHYGLDRAWEAGMRPYAKRIMVIDDLADRDHDCDLLLDQNLHDAPQERYRSRVPQGTQLFLGPHYAMLRSEFDAPGLERMRDGSVNRLLVFLGADPHNHVFKIVQALRALGPLLPETVVVLGAAHPSFDMIIGSAHGLPGVEVMETTERMAQLMAWADLAIGTCGVSAWERCLLGVPGLVVVTAENQREDAEILHRLGAVECLGDAEHVDAQRWEFALRAAMNDPQRLRSMSAAAHAVMMGRGAALTEMEGALIDDIA